MGNAVLAFLVRVKGLYSYSGGPNYTDISPPEWENLPRPSMN